MLLLGCAQLVGMSLASRVSRKFGPCALVYETPASKKGDTSVGKNGKLSNPNPSVPNSGIRNSAFTTPTLLPNNRWNAGQPTVAACDPAAAPVTSHSSLLNDPSPH